ncbi:transient receptor potential cation channel subfamily M member-like 2 isoform X3 [Porites lutea]|uniref:transient receptor potential cation channel subfamily M member-like 2 isoform X3 n=1 Tax=Porites lutea TaxID=51062 RepID=UPI003CC619D1
MPKDASSKNNLISDEESDNVDAKEMTAPQETKTSWIWGTFRKRTCRWYIPSEVNEYRCCCGRNKQDHSGDALLSNGKKGDEWEVSKHTVSKPTNAFGELEFQGAGQVSRAKYIRVSYDTDPEKVLRLLFTEWKLDLPKLLISVTGGAKNFVLNPKLKQFLRKGLLKAAQTTGAWIITGGTNTGVMRHVGEAVRGHTVMSRGAQLKDNTQQVHLIGIATWGIVDHREHVIGKQEVAPYQMTSSMISKGACLDNNHTHFILVDDGTINKYGGEISFRASLENCISRKQMEKSCDRSHGVPVVLLVLEGGPNTIRTVLESVTRNPAVPVVVAEGSGRAADILAYAHRFISQSSGALDEMADVVEHHQLLLKIEKAFPECDEEGCLKIYENVLRCVGNKRYITVFSVNEEGMDIDRAILKALLNGHNASPSDQLSLALIWNRADIAKCEIFNKERKWEIPVLESAMFEALVKERVEFVDLLLENGVSMSSFLTAQRLEDLYRSTARKSCTLRRLLGGKMALRSFKLADIVNILERLLGITLVNPHHEYGSIKRGLANMKMFMSHSAKDDDSYFGIGFRLPYNELLLWAVLCNFHKMALFMWERGDENLAKALVAGKLFRSLAKEMAKDELKGDVSEELEAHSREFLSIALGLLDECYRTNEDLAQQLLTYNLENWGDQCCLSLAVATRHEEFVAHTCCQTLLTEIWMGAMKLDEWATLKTVLGILCPPTIPFKEFKNKKELCQMPVTYEEYEQEQAKSDQDEEETCERNSEKLNGNVAQFSKGDSQVNLRSLSTHSRSGSSDSLSVIRRGCRIDENAKAKRGAKNLSLGHRLYEFYRAPITKFWGNVMLHSEAITLNKKIKKWASSKWNLCDACAVVLFFIAVGFRIHPGTIAIGHTLYCLDIMLWIIRVLDIFSVSKILGPYVVMIGRMTIDMAYFLLIMVVFLMAYGVAQQGILFPQETGSWGLISKVFFRPYFQVYGELFIEDNVYNDKETTAFNTPRHDEFGGTLVTVIMALFLLVANILLLNLLIAIFNNTFSNVQANSNQIWKFQRYHLIMEYAHRPLLVPPFIIINHIYLLYKACFKRRCCKKRSKLQRRRTDKKLKLFLEKQDVHKLMLFEEQCTESYLQQKDTLFHATPEERVRVIGTRVEVINSHLRETSRENETKVEQITKKVNTIEERLSRMEEYTIQVLDMLANIHDPHTSPPGEIEDTSGEGDALKSESEEMISRSLPQRMFSRMMSVPAYVHRATHAGSSSSLRSTPMYFRHKVPHSNPYPSWYRQASNYGNWRRKSLQKAIRKFKRSNTAIIQDEPLVSSESQSAKESTQMSHNPPRQPPLRRSESEGATQLQGDTAIHGKSPGRRRSNTLPSYVQFSDAFAAARRLGLHVQARQSPYPNSNQQRYPVPDFLVDWDMPFPGYAPPNYTAFEVMSQADWADIDILEPAYKHVELNFNDVGRGVDRRSYQGVYEVVNGVPRNPMGRTGIAGRGLLGRWGPNHAADPIVTRWKKTPEGTVMERFGKSVLEFVAIQRRDNLQWALPGGMVEVDDTVSKTLRKEFCEEALCSEGATREERQLITENLEQLFSNGIAVYKGYVDDPRNTDNAWIETVAMNYHDDTGNILDNIQLKAGDDACGVQWQEVSGQLSLYANHIFLLEKVAELHAAYY